MNLQEKPKQLICGQELQHYIESEPLQSSDL